MVPALAFFGIIVSGYAGYCFSLVHADRIGRLYLYGGYGHGRLALEAQNGMASSFAGRGIRSAPSLAIPRGPIGLACGVGGNSGPAGHSHRTHLISAPPPRQKPHPHRPQDRES